MKKLVKGLMALVVVMGVTTSAQAGWIRLNPDTNRIGRIMVQANRAVIYVQNNSCTGTGEKYITLLPSHPAYKDHLLLFHRASLEGLRMDVLVNCPDTSTGTVVLFVQH